MAAALEFINFLNSMLDAIARSLIAT